MFTAEVYGAEVSALLRSAARFASAADEVRARVGELDRAFVGTRWLGRDADRARSRWGAIDRGRMLEAAGFLGELAHRLATHADEQHRASSAGTAHHGLVGPPALALPVGSLAAVTGGVVGLAAVRAPIVAASGDAILRVADGVAAPIAVVGRRPSRFDGSDDGRRQVLDAFLGIADGDRIRRDEIEVRALDHGTYVVVLPGVTDLSEGMQILAGAAVSSVGTPIGVVDAVTRAVAFWRGNDDDTVRKMRYATGSARSADAPDPYAAAVVDALDRAGVPAGASIMLVGHSYGAYAAIDLAADPTVNANAGPAGPIDPRTDGRVRITHVLAAGADTDWRLDDVPVGTSVIVVNNSRDTVVAAEDLLHGDGTPTAPNHLQIEFDGGWGGFGHDEHHYLDWISTVDDPAVETWFDSVGELYAGGGVRVSAAVPDPEV